MTVIKFIVLLALIGVSCTSVDKKVNVLPEAKKMGSDDTLNVNSTCVVFIKQDTSVISARKRALGERDFQIGFDDYAYYTNEAYSYFEKQRIKIIEAEGKRFVRFQSSNGHS